MFLHLSVSHSVHRGAGVAGGVHGGCAWWWGACVVGGVLVGVCAWQGACMAGRACVAGGMHGGGTCMAAGCVWQGSMCGRGHAWWGGMHATHAPQHYEIRSVNAQTVCILLECILVLILFSFHATILLFYHPQ